MPAGKQQIELTKYQKELDGYIKRAGLFLSGHGEQITTLNQLREIDVKEENLVAVVEPSTGVVCFFNYTGIKDNNRVNFNRPEKIYQSRVSQDGSLDDNYQRWAEIGKKDNYGGIFSIGFGDTGSVSGNIGKDIYKITSPNLVQRIEDVFSNPKMEVKL